MKRLSPPHQARGVALLELAFILPILLLIVFGALEFSLAISQYKTLALQARIGARYLSSRTPGDQTARTEAICLVKYGVASAPSCTGTLLLPALGSATVTVSDAVTNSTTHKTQATSSNSYQVRVNLVTVTISGYQYQPYVGGFLSGLTGASTITFNPIHATMRQTL